MLKKEQIGKVRLYLPKEAAGKEPDITAAQLLEIVQQYKEADYHSEITRRKNWEIMYQLAESRGNVLEWLTFPAAAKVLELGAGCGTITSVLLQKGLQVTALEPNADYCRVNALRHQDKDHLEIYGYELDKLDDRLDRDYDVACLIGGLAKAGDDLLKMVYAHLKPGGILIIATENKFGLKYWAGNVEEHTSICFAGLEHIAKQQGVALYTRRGLEQLLTDNGFSRLQFYYPYPDYRFTREIYSDEYLPAPGALSYNITNYEADRMLLFDEQKVYDTIIEEGQFPLFSNSYLCIAARPPEKMSQQKMPQEKRTLLSRDIVYSRYASERALCLALRTDIQRIYNGNEIFKVYKSPLNPEAVSHVEHIINAYEQLSNQYAPTSFYFNRCKRKVFRGADGAEYPVAEFAYISGKSLQDTVEQAIASNDMEQVTAILNHLFQSIRSSRQKQTFFLTKEFCQVFGTPEKGAIPEQAICCGVSDIDLILGNILVDEAGNWNVIDYEWSFFFPVPQNFIIYRTLYFLNLENPDNPELSMKKLLELAGISQEEAACYGQMETHFQNYVTGGLVPYREMVNLLNRRFFRVLELKADYDRVVAQNELLKGKGIWKLARKLKKRLTREK